MVEAWHCNPEGLIRKLEVASVLKLVIRTKPVIELALPHDFPAEGMFFN